MEDTKSTSFSVTRLVQVTPILRGLLADPTGNDDMPYRPVVLQSLTDPAAIQFAAATEQPGQTRPAPLERIASPLLTLDVAANYESVAAFQKQAAAQLEAYSAQYGIKPQAICLPRLGIVAVREDAPDDPDATDSGRPLYHKVALVTGSAGAIGHGLCKALLQQGAYVAASDLPGEKLDHFVQEFAAAVGKRVMGVPIDVTDRRSIAQGLEQITQTWGGVDIVVINAGIALAVGLLEMGLEAFQAVERVNIEGTLLTLAEAGKLMAAQGTGGDIVLISSKNVFAPAPKFGAYSATKAASHQLGRIASQELAEFKIRVNMVSPDAIFSDGNYKSGLWATVGPDRMKSRGLDAAGLEEYYRQRNLLKMRVTAQHVANAMLFFVTHQTPTTGATIPVDGGLPDSTPR
jgi:NAD(P)-dependent dehydrogenase (short-subunit alcohol dehydrogenase family)